MKVVTLLMALVVSLVAGLSSGCEKSEKIVVKYRGRAIIETKAQITKDKVAIGYVDEVLTETGMQRVVLRIQHANQASTGDRFVPVRDDAGKMGFRIFPGREGSPLQNGAEIEADPLSMRRGQAVHPASIQAAANGNAVPPAPEMLAPPVTGANRPTIEESRQFREKLMRRQEDRIQESIGQLLTRGAPPKAIAPDMALRFENFGRSMDGKSVQEAQAILESEGGKLQQELEAYAVEAQQNGNQAAAVEARQLSRRLELSTRKTRRLYDSNEHRGAIESRRPKGRSPAETSSGR